MFDYLVEANGLRPVMEEHGLVLPEDLDFIKEQIAGPLDKTAAKGEKVLSVIPEWNMSVTSTLHCRICDFCMK